MTLQLTCVASTGEQFRLTQQHGRQSRVEESNCFRSAQWSADGTTIITLNEDWRLRSFILPTDLLDAGESTLTPYSTSDSYQNYAVALFPYYSLADPSTTLLVHSRTDLPIRLTNALDLGFTHATYPWIHPTTEAYIAPHSLAFSLDGSHIIAGAKEHIAIFDISKDGEGPMLHIPTRTGRKMRKITGEAGVGLQGLVMALAVSCEGILAAGTTGRQIGLWQASGLGEHMAAFSVADDEEPGTHGCGITQLVWSSCGRFLFVAERSSDAMLVYDIRGTGRRICWLRGRKAKTMQPLTFDVIDHGDGNHDVWAGGTDGQIRVWTSVTSKEGALDADKTFQAHKDNVTSVDAHPCRTVFATSSGQRRDPQDFADTDGSERAAEQRPPPSENTLKIWTL